MPEEEVIHFPGHLILWLALLGVIIFILVLLSPRSNPIAYFFGVVIPEILKWAV